MKRELKGVFTAIATPFKGGEIDYGALERLCDQQVEDGIDGLVALGTTGEGPTIGSSEREELVKFLVKRYKGKTLVIVGAGTNDTQESLLRLKQAKSLGADMAMVVNPYYNKPNQEGLKRHFLSLADADELDLMLYNIQGRTSVNIGLSALIDLAEHPRIVAVKEASGDVSQIMQVIQHCGEKLSVLLGDDLLAAPMAMMGAKGVVSVASHVIARPLKEMLSHIFEGRYDEARKIHYHYEPIMRKLFIDTNPLPVKAALSMMGIIENELRLPLVPLSESLQEDLKRTLKERRLL